VGSNSPESVSIATAKQHYNQAVSAIAAKSEPEALSALDALQKDMEQLPTNTLTLEAELAHIEGATKYVKSGDWESANREMMEVKSLAPAK